MDLAIVRRGHFATLDTMTGVFHPDAIEDRRGFEEILPHIQCAMRLELPLLITGGDERMRTQLAEAVHRRSVRSRGPLVVERRSWNRAEAGESIAGSLESARCGTLFVPEIAALDDDGQTELVRFFRQRSSDSVEAVTAARVITASAEDVFERVQSNALRADLFYYLNVLQIALPSLAA